MANTNVAVDNDGFTELGGGVAVFIRPKYLNEGDVIQGTFTKMEREMGKFKHPAIFMVLTKSITYSDPKTAERVYEAGESIAVNVPGQLRSLIERSNLLAGTEIRLTYEGKSIVKAGPNKGAEAHGFKLGVKGGQAAPATASEALPE